MSHGTHIEIPGGYTEAKETAAFIVRRDRRFLRVFGRDPVKMVQGLITNDLAGAPENRSVYAAMLTPKGRMIADMRLFRRGPDVLIETDADAADNIAAHLKKFVPPLFARSEDASAKWGVLTVAGPEAARVLERLTGAQVSAEENVISGSGDLIAVGGRLPGSIDVIAPAAEVERLGDELAHAGVAPLDHRAYEVLRVEAGIPAWAAELDDTVIPLEAGLRHELISETKGCYTGQEVIIRILHRGHVNRHLRGLLLGDRRPPGKGTPLFNADGKNVGMITSSVRSPARQQTIALGYVRREIVPPATLHLDEPGGSIVHVVELPF